MKKPKIKPFHWGTFSRYYRGDPAGCMGLINKLSYQISNMKVPIGELQGSIDGYSVTVTRFGAIEMVNISGGNQYFEIKILRDDGTWIGEDDIFSLEIFPDDHDVPVMYVYNYRDSYSDPPSADDIIAEDTFYNLKADGTRDRKRYNEDSHTWKFDGYQRPWPWMWGDTETSDLTKPTSPPYLEGGADRYSRKYSDSEGKYEVKTSPKGYYIVVYERDKSIKTYYKKLEEGDPKTKLKRGFKVSGGRPDWEDASLLRVGTYIVRIPYFSIETTAEYINYVHYEGYLLPPWPWTDVDAQIALVEGGPVSYPYGSWDRMYSTPLSLITYPMSTAVISTIGYVIRQTVDAEALVTFDSVNDEEPPERYFSNYPANISVASTLINASGYHVEEDETQKYDRTISPCEIVNGEPVPISGGEVLFDVLLTFSGEPAVGTKHSYALLGPLHSAFETGGYADYDYEE